MNPNTSECCEGHMAKEAPCVKSLIVESKGRDAGFSFYSRRETEGQSSGIRALGPDQTSPHYSGCGLVPAHV